MMTVQRSNLPRFLPPQSIPFLAAVLAGFFTVALPGNLRSESADPHEFLKESSGAETLDLEPAHPASAARRPQRPRPPTPGVYKLQITPHWFQNNTRFWYRNDLKDAAKEFLVVDAGTGKREPAFDHQKLAEVLGEVLKEKVAPDHLPFSSIEFGEGATTVVFEAGGKKWQCEISNLKCTPVVPAEPAPKSESGEDKGKSEPGKDAEAPSREGGRRSPDGHWRAFVRDHNVYAQPLPEGEAFPLTSDGTETNHYGLLDWSPGSKSLVAWRIETAEIKEVYLIQSSPSEKGRALFRHRPYALPGDKFPFYELNLLNPDSRQQLKPKIERFEHEWERPALHWEQDGRHFAYMQEDRGHQRLRIIEVESSTGDVRNVLDEKSDTFIWTAHTENLRLQLVNWLEHSDEMVYVSERDGWRHLYLLDVREGKIRDQITKGEFVVRGIESIDEDKRQIWFSASGMNGEQDPYFLHHYRINFDGSGLVALTEANGDHEIQFSPDRNFVIDTCSRVDLPPVHELRRANDGKLVCKFEEADATDLLAEGWHYPEVFSAPGRDGKTQIWGIIVRPQDFDPSKKYPVIENLYAGPQSSYVPKRFGRLGSFTSLANLGFVVVQIDGMGTANRSKAFHDVCWRNLKDAGFPDRILWHKAVAAKYPWYDISRVGTFGTSAGGQSAAGALLFHPDFYKVAVANCGCHDNRMDKASWNEQWMGYPVGPQYADSSNIENAANLRGHLMLVVGELDENVPPESTYRFVDALIRANKDFDLLVVPNGGHGAGGAYGQRRLQDFFLRHLAAVEPPNRNAESVK